MANLINSNALTFDDILLVPQHSDIASRKDVDISTELFGAKFPVPLCSANMDTVTGEAMAATMYQLGGLGFLHRYTDHETILKWVQEIHQHKGIAIPSIGIKEEDFRAAMQYADEGVLAVNIDIAHGDSAHMIKMIQRLRAEGIEVVAGNIASYDAAINLAAAGANVLKVGVGPGSMCTTRIVTGHGVPQLTAIEECVKIKQAYPRIKIIADGGIRNSGDCVKALAFGADMIMIGSMLAGTDETPGEKIRVEAECPYFVKEYRGMASSAARSSVAKVDSSYVAEGERTYVPWKGPAKNVIDQLVGGIRSGLSYSGAYTIKQLQEVAEYVIITNNGVLESRPHGVK